MILLFFFAGSLKKVYINQGGYKTDDYGDDGNENVGAISNVLLEHNDFLFLQIYTFSRKEKTRSP